MIDEPINLPEGYEHVGDLHGTPVYLKPGDFERWWRDNSHKHPGIEDAWRAGYDAANRAKNRGDHG